MEVEAGLGPLLLSASATGSRLYHLCLLLHFSYKSHNNNNHNYIVIIVVLERKKLFKGQGKRKKEKGEEMLERALIEIASLLCEALFLTTNLLPQRISNLEPRISQPEPAKTVRP